MRGEKYDSQATGVADRTGEFSVTNPAMEVSWIYEQKEGSSYHCMPPWTIGTIGFRQHRTRCVPGYLLTSYAEFLRQGSSEGHLD